MHQENTFNNDHPWLERGEKSKKLIPVSTSNTFLVTSENNKDGNVHWNLE